MFIKGRYRHYKGKEYEVVGTARHSETLEEMVVYRALYGDHSLWVRPRKMFEEDVLVDGKRVKRFIFLKEETVKYNKLVRDKILAIIAQRGGAAKHHSADDAEYWMKLKEKLQEEVHEFLEAENMEELADVLEVLDAIAAHKRFDPQEVKMLKEKKLRTRDGFAKRIILEETSD